MCRWGIKILKIAKGLDRDHAAGHRVIISHTGFQILGQDFPGAPGKPGKQPAIGHKKYAKPFGDGKYPLAMRHMLQYFLAQPFTELDDSFLVAGGAEMTALTGKRQKIFMAAIQAPHPGKSQAQVPAVQIPVNHVPDIRSEKSILTLIAIIPDHLQVFKMILHALEVRRLMRIAWFVKVI